MKSLLESLLDSYSKNFVQHEIDSSPTGRFHVERMFEGNGEFRPEFSPKTLLNIGNSQKGFSEIENAGDGDVRPKTI